MADLVVEQIMGAIVTAVTGLATTGASVSRKRAYDLATLPFLTVSQGADTTIDDSGGSLVMGYVDSVLEVTVAAYVKDNVAIETDLNAIRKEVHAGVMADHTLGGACIDVFPRGSSEPLTSAGEQPTGMMEIYFNVRYRYQRDDASVKAN